MSTPEVIMYTAWAVISLIALPVLWTIRSLPWPLKLLCALLAPAFLMFFAFIFAHDYYTHRKKAR